MAGKPEINSKVIRSCLDRVVSTQNTTEIEAGLALALVDAYDRRITRESYVELLESATIMQGLCVRLRLLHLMTELSRGGRLTTEKLEETSAKLVQHAEGVREKVASVVNAQSQCPTDEDTLN